MYISSVTKLANQYWENGNLVPFGFSFPSFEINSDNFKYYVWETVSDRLELAIESDLYDIKKKFPTLTIEKMKDAQQARINNNQSLEQSKINNWVDNDLFKKMLQDENLSPRKISRTALKIATKQGIQSCIFELHFLQDFQNLSNSQEEYSINEFKLAATLEMVKVKLPSIYRDCMNILNDNPFCSIKERIQKISHENPDEVRQHILISDKDFFEISANYSPLKP